jgi:parallel beta-helix repeat protein
MKKFCFLRLATALIVLVVASGYPPALVHAGTSQLAATLQTSVVYPSDGILTPGQPEIVRIGATVQPSPGTPLHAYRLLLRVRGKNGRTVLSDSFHPKQVYSVAKLNMENLLPGEYELTGELHHDGLVVLATQKNQITKRRPAGPTPTVAPTPTATPSADPPTATPTRTVTQSATQTASATATRTATATGTRTAAPTATATAKPTSTRTPTPIVTSTRTATSTPTGPTPTPTLTSSLPSGVPTPPAIPPIPALNSPVTIKPGASFGGFLVYGDGATDDTQPIQAALNTSDVIVAPATYAIAGSVTIPTGRNISCQSGAIFFDPQTLDTRMFQIGWGDPSSNGNNSIVGCTFKGTDTANDFSTYQGGSSGYSELLEISTGGGQHTNNVLIQNNTFLDAQGDSIITYSPCGPNNTGSPCNNGAPGTEGPSNIFVVNNNISHCIQPGVHLNGGQNIVVTGNTITDCWADDEVDSNVLQVISSWWHDNIFTTQYGGGLFTTGAAVHTCTGNDLIAEDDHLCYSYNNLITGVGPLGPATMFEPTGCTGGGGHYINETLTNGAQMSTGC